MSGFNFDKTAWGNQWMDTPLGRPGGETAQDAMTKPGNCVKSKEKEDQGHGFPVYHGKVSTFKDEKVVVIGHQDNKFIWEGTQDEYFEIWDCD